MHFYVASSFKNLPQVQALQKALLARGHTVADWGALAPPIPATASPEERKRLLDTDERGTIFRFCASHVGYADRVIYLGPSGQDAGVEVGMAYSHNIPVWGVAGPDERPGLMLHGAVQDWFETTEALLEELDRTAEAYAA
ncbi:hypothetical protein [Desulfovibrio cuneatus]|uniref:hypothetical protein n=1 Tax=Desulfovibrio cuneatus TaxID=159728 RepID=UPI0003FCA55B|nr:hypothetical protein [Desulfovibrio cuneatus]